MQRSSSTNSPGHFISAKLHASPLLLSPGLRSTSSGPESGTSLVTVVGGQQFRPRSVMIMGTAFRTVGRRASITEPAVGSTLDGPAARTCRHTANLSQDRLPRHPMGFNTASGRAVRACTFATAPTAASCWPIPYAEATYLGSQAVFRHSRSPCGDRPETLVKPTTFLPH